MELSTGILKSSQLEMYNEEQAWASAIVAFACHRNYSHLKPLIFGINSISINLMNQLDSRGIEFDIWSPSEEDRSKYPQALDNIEPGQYLAIGLFFNKYSITPEIVECFERGSVILDASLNSLELASIALARENAIPTIRLDMRGSLRGEIEGILESHYVISNAMGTRETEGITFVAGGLIGKLGDIVVDSITEPNQVIGIADGKGGLLLDTGSYQKDADKIREYLLLNRLKS